MNILAKYNDEKVYIVNIRENGNCDVVRTVTNEQGASVGELILVKKTALKIIDNNLLTNADVPIYSIDNGKVSKYDADLKKSKEELQAAIKQKLTNADIVEKKLQSK